MASEPGKQTKRDNRIKESKIYKQKKTNETKPNETNKWNDRMRIKKHSNSDSMIRIVSQPHTQSFIFACTTFLTEQIPIAQSIEY
jgi:hypothetical protein